MGKNNHIMAMSEVLYCPCIVVTMLRINIGCIILCQCFEMKIELLLLGIGMEWSFILLSTLLVSTS